MAFALPITNGERVLKVSKTSSVATLKKLKTLDGPLKKPQKTPGEICTDFGKKIELFLGKIELFRKKVAFFPKNF